MDSATPSRSAAPACGRPSLRTGLKRVASQHSAFPAPWPRPAGDSRRVTPQAQWSGIATALARRGPLGRQPRAQLAPMLAQRPGRDGQASRNEGRPDGHPTHRPRVHRPAAASGAVATSSACAKRGACVQAKASCPDRTGLLQAMCRIARHSGAPEALERLALGRGRQGSTGAPWALRRAWVGSAGRLGAWPSASLRSPVDLRGSSVDLRGLAGQRRRTRRTTSCSPQQRAAGEGASGSPSGACGRLRFREGDSSPGSREKGQGQEPQQDHRAGRRRGIQRSMSIHTRAAAGRQPPAC